jgi:energy-coupling factor transport system permease protein
MNEESKGSSFFVIRTWSIVAGEYAWHAFCMQTTLYIAADTPIHSCDARVKSLLLLAFSIAAFFIESPTGMCVVCATVFVLMLIGRLPLARVCCMLLPVAVLAAFAIAFNMVSSGVSAGFALGLVAALRMVCLVAASFIVCFTSTSTELVDALTSLLSPLRALRVPVDDVAFVLSLAMRFIPLIFNQLDAVLVAQSARGAQLSFGPIGARIKAWGAVFVPLLVGLFRRADSMAVAMDARCYGASASRVYAAADGSELISGSRKGRCRSSAPIRRGSLRATEFGAREAMILIVGIAYVCLIAILL